MTKQEMLYAIQKDTDFQRLGVLLEMYALEALDNNELRSYDPAMVQLSDMICEHMLCDYYLDRNGEGNPWYIRSGSKALLTYVYCSLKEWFPEPDIGNVLRVGEKMHCCYLKADKSRGDLDERKIRNIMIVLDEKFSYSTIVFGEIIPIFLVMDVVPFNQSKCSFRTGCDQTYRGLVIWRYHNPVLPVPSETTFLLKLSDMLFLKAWVLDEDEVRSRIGPKLEELGYGWVLEENGERIQRHIGDLVCIGLAHDTPLFRYMPFSGQSHKYRSCCKEITETMIEIAGSGNHCQTRTFD